MEKIKTLRKVICKFNQLTEELYSQLHSQLKEHCIDTHQIKADG